MTNKSTNTLDRNLLHENFNFESPKHTNCATNLSRNNTGFASIKIKKSSIVRRGSQKFEFVPLASPITTNKNELSLDSMDSHFVVDGVSSEIQDLVDSFGSWNEEWADIVGIDFKRGAN